HHVRVKLRIAGARETVPIGGRHETLPPNPPQSIVTTTSEASLPLHIGERRLDRPLVRLEQRARDILVGDREQHADRLRRREPQPNRGHIAPARGRSTPSTCPGTATVTRPEDPRMVALSAKAEAAKAAADPAARCLATAREVVLESLSDLLLVVFELIDRRAE